MSDLKLLQCRLDNRYDIEDCLGRGSYAEIYIARDLAATDERFRDVVIKALNVLLQGYQDPDLERTLIQNFQNEAIALDRVRHPNIISRLGHGTAIDLNGTAFHYIVLEYLGGGDLAKLCRSEPLTLDRALTYLKQVCAGLAHAHECGVIHRDIKPQNLLLTADREIVKIADFGVARLEGGEGAITRVGTNIYAPPEHNPLVQTSQLDITAGQSPVQLTPAADIYSLAKTAYTLICGASPRPFAHQAITQLPMPIASQPWGGSLLRVLERATQTRAADRYQSVQDFWEDLNDVAMPVTQPLALAAARPRISSDLNVDEVLTAAAPPRPKFETSRELRQQQIGTNGSPRPKIVVPIAGHQSIPNANVFPVAQSPGRMTVPVPSALPAAPGPTNLAAKPRNRRRDYVVGLVLVLCFAGLLAATGAYVRKWIKMRTGQQTTATTTTDNGRQAVTKTDVNLRAGPNSQTDIIGLAEFGSKVQVLNTNTNNNWCEVQVIQHSRPKKDPTSSDRGWMNRTYLNFD
ncbi:MAG TPA: protein kinase [Pyrinomonadaceae bacterium]|nr:protein kinase [Pyrinomonadaceae bacterium]